MKLRNVKKYFIKAEIWQKYHRKLSILNRYSVSKKQICHLEKNLENVALTSVLNCNLSKSKEDKCPVQSYLYACDY